MASAESERKPYVQLVVAASSPEMGIGVNGALPWRLPLDLRRFKALTLDGMVVMGRKTWDSLPTKSRPLPRRTNVVLTSDIPAFLNKYPREAQAPDVLLAASLPAAKELIQARLSAAAQLQSAPGRHQHQQQQQQQQQQQKQEERQQQHAERGAASCTPLKVFVIGGASIYKACLDDPDWSSSVLLTRVFSAAPCDTFFPLNEAQLVERGFELAAIDEPVDDNGTRTQFVCFRRGSSSTTSAAAVNVESASADFNAPSTTAACGNPEEQQYLELVRRVLAQGVCKGDRTGTGTLSLFGAQMRFDLRGGRFPLLTTKRVFWRGVAEEMLWFVSGNTDATALQKRGIHIWDGNGSRAFLDKMGFHARREGDLGPVYGFQWRHFGAKYESCDADYRGRGVDQLAEVIETIKNNPNDRRMVVSAWNPNAIAEMALPPCHMFFQFYVANSELSCQMYQRSCDLGLGVPFNIASYALLTVMVAHVTGLRPGELVHVLGDAHIYLNHVDALKQQLSRTPNAFPTLRVVPRDDLQCIDDFRFEDFELTGYTPQSSIAMTMAV